jgi:Ca2+-binding EF-hand superfamily protein
MRFIFALMDSDGDGTVSLQEFQAAHEKIFKAMDTDKDGTLTLEEIQAFMRGTGRSKEHGERRSTTQIRRNGTNKKPGSAVALRAG